MKLIAELATTHGGDLDNAIEMIRVAKSSGAGCVKFQHVNPLHFKPDAVWRGWNLRDWYKRCYWNEGQWRQIMKECDYAGVEFLCTPQTLGDLDELIRWGVHQVKVSSDNLTNLPMLHRIVETQLDCYFSIGMADQDDLDRALGILSNSPATNTLMVCTSLYPCPADQVHLNRVWALLGAPCDLGFSDHTESNTAAVMAYGMGCRAFEKHLSALMGVGPDADIGASPSEFTDWTLSLHEAEEIMGSEEIAPVAGARAALEMTE